jgi:hypothetical protein
MGISECSVCGKTCWFEEHKDKEGKLYCGNCWKKLTEKKKDVVKKTKAKKMTNYIVAFIVIIIFLFLIFWILSNILAHSGEAIRASQLAEEECIKLGCKFILGNCVC